MIAVDASVWVSLFVEEEQHHADSREWIERQLRARESMVAPMLLAVEVAGAVARRSGDAADGHAAFARLRRNRQLNLVPLDDRRGILAARLAANLRLRGADATYVAVALEYGVPLVTWDHEHLSRASSIIQVFTPLTAPPAT